METVREKSGSTLGAAIWIGVAAIIPLYRLILADFTTLLPYAIIAALVASVALGRVARPPFAPLWLAALVVIPLAATVSGTNTSIVQSLSVGIKLALLVGLAPFVLTYYIHRDQHFVRRATTAFLSVQTLSSAAGLAQLTGVTILGRTANEGRANGLAAHPNVLGMMSGLAILICVWLIANHSSTRRSVLVGVLLVNVAALVATGSLSSMLSLAIALVIQLLCMRITVKALFVVVIGVGITVSGLMTVGVGPSTLTDSVAHRVDVVSGSADDGVASVEIRERTYAFAWESIGQDPLTGVGMDGRNEGTYDGKTVVHNFLLRAWYQGGILLVAAILALTIVLVRIVFSSILLGRDAVPAGIITSIVTFAATSAFYDQQQYWLPLLFAVVMTGPRAVAALQDSPSMADAR